MTLDVIVVSAVVALSVVAPELGKLIVMERTAVLYFHRS